MDDKGLQMTLQWDDENDLFVLSYLEGERALFQVKMAPESFEKLTHDMVKTIKNYNLFKAQQYMERKDVEEKNGKGNFLPDLSSSDQPDQAKSEQSQGDK